MKVLLLHNPEAGDVGLDERDLTAMLRKSGCDVTYVPTDSPAMGRALSEPVDLVVVAGGDGTVAMVLSQATPQSAPLTILPLGTANNLARAVGIRGDIPELIAGFHDGRMTPRRREAALEWLSDPESGGPAPVDLYTARRVTVQWRDTPSHLDDYFHDAPEQTCSMKAWLEPAAINLLVPGTRAG